MVDAGQSGCVLQCYKWLSGKLTGKYYAWLMTLELGMGLGE